jgi:hypothetical protein
MMLIVIAAALIALVMLAMAVGVVFKNRCLRGSCGGPEILDPNGDPLSCATCPNRNKQQTELPGTSPRDLPT